MKLSKNEFKRLQDEWYEKLRKNGFNDIEKANGNELVLVTESSQCYRRKHYLCCVLKAEYFAWITREVHNEETVFRNEIDRYILIRYSEGAKIKSIVEELELSGSPRDRGSIRFIIRRYEMEWGIRSYDYKQLHKNKA